MVFRGPALHTAKLKTRVPKVLAYINRKFFVGKKTRFENKVAAQDVSFSSLAEIRYCHKRVVKFHLYTACHIAIR